MRRSVIDNKSEINPNKWVLSVINTKQGTGGAVSGHVKIIVEGARTNPTLFNTEFFTTEYHIMEAKDAIAEETWIPQCFRNTKSEYVVLINRNPVYSEEQKEKVSKSIMTRSFYRSPVYVQRMTDAIEVEQKQIDEGERTAHFQYFGNWTILNYKGGHNCATWACEKLELAGIKDFKLTDFIMAAPSSHTSSSSSSSCLIS